MSFLEPLLTWKPIEIIMRVINSGIRHANKKDKKIFIWLSIIFIIILIALFCILFFSGKSNALTLAQKTEATKGVPLFNMPGMSDEEIFVPFKMEVQITPGDYRRFADFRLCNIEAALKKIDGLLKTGNAKPYAANLYPLFLSNKKEESTLLADLMDNYYLNLVEKLDLDHNLYSLSLSVSRTAGAKIDDAITFFRGEDPCIQSFLEQKVIGPIVSQGQAVLSLSEFRKAMVADCPHSHALIEILGKDCNGNENCGNLYFSRGAFEINSMSIKMLTTLTNLITKMIPKLNIQGLNIQLEGFADASPLKGAIPVEGGFLTADTGTALDGNAGNKIYSITSNEDLSVARAYSCWKFMLERIADTSIHLSYTGRGVTTASANSEENRIVRIVINKVKP